MRLPEFNYEVYPEDISSIHRGLENDLSGDSPAVKQYEEALASFYRSTYSTAVSSGTAALVLALDALGVSPGTEVILPPTCPLCTLYPVIATGAHAVFADIAMEGFGLDIDDVKQALTDKTRAIVEVPMWGYPTRVDILRQFCSDHGVALLLDLAHCHGTTLHGKHLSQYGHISCFSTHARKVLSTGEGGFILTDNGEWAQHVYMFSRFGKLDGKTLGLNYKLSALQAILGKSRLARLPHDLALRKKNAQQVVNGIDRADVKHANVVNGGEPNFHALLLTAGYETRRLRRHLVERGIPCDVARYECRPLYQYKIASRFRRQCPRAERVFEHTTTIPVHPGIGQAELEYIAKCINSF
jgi:dTDP-4-amino-4,6-dideoxygalactose transaminase